MHKYACRNSDKEELRLSETPHIQSLVGNSSSRHCARRILPTWWIWCCWWIGCGVLFCSSHSRKANKTVATRATKKCKNRDFIGFCFVCALARLSATLVVFISHFGPLELSYLVPWSRRYLLSYCRNWFIYCLRVSWNWRPIIVSSSRGWFMNFSIQFGSIKHWSDQSNISTDDGTLIQPQKQKLIYNAEARQLYKSLGSLTSWGNHSQWEHTLGPGKSTLQTNDGLDRRQARVYCSLELDLIGNG